MIRSYGILFILAFLSSFTVLSQRYQAITSGVAWFDQNNKEVNAHGGCVVKEGDKYYLFGEYKSDTINAFSGFSCYSSPDLINWTFEKIVLPVQKDGLLGPSRIGERVKVMKSPSTGEFVMYMHCDDLKYNDPHVGYATSKTINGDYQFQGDLLHNGKYLRKWDLGTFQDTDGKGYLLTHEGFIYELSKDYKSVKNIVVSDIAKGGESPAMLKSKDLYYWLFSNKTSWERNDNYYLTSKNLAGPWENKGTFAPEGSLTWYSQCSFVFPLITNAQDTLHIYMGDRWSYPRQGSAATQVWLPVSIENGKMSVPRFLESWYPDNNGYQLTAFNDRPTDNNRFVSNEKGTSITVPFKGRRIAIRGISKNTGGYARVTLKNKKNDLIINTIVDFYSKIEIESLKFVSPLLPINNYMVTIEVMGEHGVWYKKDGTQFGSTDNYITINDLLFE